MSVKTTEQDRNEQLIRRLYHLAEATSKDTQQFVSLFADGGYFYMDALPFHGEGHPAHTFHPHRK
jgi:hypothetical protein